MIPLLIILFFLAPIPSLSKPTLTVTPKTLTKSGDTVLIQWSNVPSPSKLDWLGIYSPPDSRDDRFIGYKFLSTSPTWASGWGSISLPITNLRSNYSFRIFRWTESEINPKKRDHDHNPIPGTAHYLADSGTIGFAPGHGPEQVHLAFTENESQMRVMFVAEDGEERYVRCGERKEEMSEVAVARVERYEREDMCDKPANASIGWRDPGWIFDAVMKGLKKGVRYYYQVGSDSKGWSETHSFVSRNEESNETIAFLFGDMGTATQYTTFVRTQDESISTVKWILRDIEALGDKPAFVSHIGDISYARGHSWLWDQFFTQIEPVASKVAYHVCIGNHEYDWPLQPWKPDWSYSIYGTDGGGECGVPYSLKFHMPGNSSELTGTRAPATRNLYYSFNMGVVHFVYISTETNFLPGSSQYNFIKHDLETVDRKKTPFVVVQGHRPMYTTSNENRDAPMRKRLLEHLEPLFVKNNVTLVLWGHVHRYERFCPLNNFTCGSLGLDGEAWEAFPVHIVIGMAGQDWQPKWEPRSDHPDDPIFPQPIRSMYRGGEFGYTRLVATKGKAATRMKKWVDKNRRPLEFKPGDLVLIKLIPEQICFRESRDQRLVRKYEGPVPVIAKVGKVSYKIEIPTWMKMHPVFHVSRLKPYRADKEDSACNQPTREEIKEQPRKKIIKEVEEILAEQEVKGGGRLSYKEFLVKWKGLEEEETSWEKVKALEQFQQKIEDFKIAQSSRTPID